MKTAGRGNPNHRRYSAHNPRSWRGSSEQISLDHVGWEARKTPAAGYVFFLDFPLYRTFSVMPRLQREPVLFTHRNSFSVLIFAVVDQMSMATLAHAGTGTVRTRPPLPTKSTMAQCSSRCCGRLAHKVFLPGPSCKHRTNSVLRIASTL